MSVILATRDDPEIVRERVDDILAADFPGARLDVVIGVDHTAALDISRYERADLPVAVVPGDPPGGKGATLNAAVRVAQGDILLFTDSAQRFEISAIRRLVVELDDPRTGMVSGALQIGRDGTPRSLAERYWLLERWLRGKEARVHSTVGVTGAIYAMRRECWLPLPAGVLLDDLYGPMRLVLRGYRIGFCGDAIAYDERRFAPAQEYRRKVRTLTGVVQVCAWLPDVLSPFRNPVWLQFVFHKLLRLLTPYLLFVMLVALLPSLRALIPRVTFARGPSAIAAVAALCAAIALVGWRFRGTIATALAMQVAVLRATINGLRGNWDVWSR